MALGPVLNWMKHKYILFIHLWIELYTGEILVRNKKQTKEKKILLKLVKYMEEMSELIYFFIHLDIHTCIHTYICLDEWSLSYTSCCAGGTRVDNCSEWEIEEPISNSTRVRYIQLRVINFWEWYESFSSPLSYG